MKEAIDSGLKNYAIYFIPFFFIVFISGFYWSPSSKLINNIFYLFLLFPLVLMIFRSRLVDFKNKFYQYRYIMLLLLVFLITSLAANNESATLFREMKRMLYVVGFIVCVDFFFAKSGKFEKPLFIMIMLVSFFTAIYLIFDWSVNHSVYTRMDGPLAFDNPIILSVTYCFSFLISLSYFLNRGSLFRFIYLLPMLASAVVVLMCQSRGPTLALLVCCFLFLFINKQWLIIVIAVSAVVVAAIIVKELGYSPRVLNVTDIRLEIWGVVFEQVKISPLLGHGLGYPDNVVVNGVVFDHAHNIYFSTLRQSGVLGLFALLLLVGQVLNTALRHKDLSLWAVIFIFGLIYMLFDGGRLFFHPNELWLVFWLPIAWIIAANNRKSYSQV